MFTRLKPKNCLTVLAGSGILAFGLFNVHSLSGVTEGGVLGLTLLLEHWLDISPAVSSALINLACYALGWRLLGHSFMLYSLLASAGFSGFYALFEWIGPFWPRMGEMPLLAAVAGALFVGVGVGLSVRAGGATGGDDALSMAIAHVTGWRLQWIYLGSDLLVLVLSLSYIPLNRILYSLLTVLISGQVIGLMQHLPLEKRDAQGEALSGQEE